MNTDFSFVGKELLCGECGHRFIVTQEMKILRTLLDKRGKVTGVTITCERCGEEVFVAAHRPRR